MQRLSALLVAVVGIPAILSIDSGLRDALIVPGRPAPRTVVAPELIRVVDGEATAVARAEAAAAVEPVLVADPEAPAAIVAEVREAFATARSVRESAATETPLGRDEQVEALASRLDMLDRRAVRRLAELSDTELAQVTAEAVGIAQLYARESVREERVDEVADRLLRIELAVRPLPPGVGEQIVEPVVRDALRPTVREDPQGTAEARERAAGAVSDVPAVYARGETVVSEGEVVSDVAFAALRSRDLAGTAPWQTLVDALAITLLLALVVCAHLRVHAPDLWSSGQRVLLLTSLLAVSALAVESVSLLPVSLRSNWSYAVPVGAVAMLATVLLGSRVGLLVGAVHAAFTALVLPGEPGLVVFVVVVSLGSVALVTSASSRADLRRAALRSTLGYAVLAGVCAAVFGSGDRPWLAAAAGLVGGIVSAVVVNGSLPFLESTFGLCTATGLLDLADRNHPLLRELEQKALGSYNHSIVVSTLAERAARAIGANALLASVAALYHDIGKTRRPYFFVENQFGITNPHDELDPEMSAAIIRSHVRDGVAMAEAHRLPAEVIEGIATHHGTTLVSFFHRKALAAAGPGGEVDEDAFRYPGPKPSRREMAVLMLADCCEGAARAAAQANRNLSRDDLDAIVGRMLAERVEGGQLDDSALTFRDLAAVRRSFTETLTGVYHPRITYPPCPPPRLAPAAEPRGVPRQVSQRAR
jgi:hypothetical protein